MLNLRKRLGASILLTVLSIVSICLLLPDSKVKQIQRITLGTTIEYTDLWKWGSDDLIGKEEEDNGNGIRLVIFGDSWVDDLVEEGHQGKGNNWPQVSCDEINCTSRLNFAASQPSSAWPSAPPTGAMTSNEIHAWAVSQNQYLRGQEYNYTEYPDLASQIQSFIALPPPKTQPQATIFVLSFGFWDIYDFAQLDLAAAQGVTDKSIEFLFDQLDVLYAHFATKLYPINSQTLESSDATNTSTHSTIPHNFQVVIPRIFDPTLVPGWITHRPVPAKPSSVAEQQKNAVYLTERWNQGMENKMGAWMERSVSIPSSSSILTTTAPKPTEPASRSDVRENTTEEEKSHDNFVQLGKGEVKQETTKEEEKTTDKEEEGENPDPHLPKKDIFYYDTSSLLLNLILEHQLEDEGLTDASGLGKGESPFNSVSVPCLRPIDLEEVVTELVANWKEKNGMLVCKEPEDFMWWDAWSLGGKGKRIAGEAIGEMVKEGGSLRAKIDKMKKVG